MEQDLPDRRRIVVDGSNIATEGRSLPSLAQLDEAIRAFLEEYRGFTTSDVTVVVDASFGHRIDPSEVPDFEQAVEHGEMVAPPAGAVGRGDGFILRIAEKSGALVLSNDSFQEFHAERPWLFEPGRLIGGKPVPGVGWIFTPRTPVRGAKSRSVTSKSKRDAKVADGEQAGPGNELNPSGNESRAGSRRGGRATKAAKAIKAANTIDVNDVDDAYDDEPTAKATPATKATRVTKATKATRATKAASSEIEPATKVAGSTKATKATRATKATKAAKAEPATKAAGSTKAAKATKATKAAKATKATKAAKATKVAKDAATEDTTTVPVGEALNEPLTFLTFVANHPVGSTFDGVVVSFTSHGAHIDVGGMLCHVPLRLLADPPPNKARQVLTKGETRTFALVSLDAARRRAELALPEML
jgi:Zc3h12a-like Ribonuclease NYN domain/S1 RNA binding domain